MHPIHIPLLLIVTMQAGPDGQSTDARTVRSLLDGHNAERAAEGKPPLKVSETLNRAAEVHARDMAEHRFLAHEGSDQSQPPDRVKRAGYHYLATGENVARGQKTVPQVVRAWMNSPKHKSNILGDFSEMGAALARAEDGQPYWAVEFGTPMPRLSPDEASRALIDAINAARAKNDPPLRPLKPAPALGRAAQSYAETLARLDTLQPTGEQIPDADPDTLVKSLEADRYRIRKLSRAVLSGSPGAAEAIKSILDNETNRKDLLSPAYQDIGVGYAFADKSGQPYWCILIANRR